MRTFLLLIPLAVMFSGARGGSTSMSCSTRNGQTICERQESSGNVAMSSSQAASGPTGTGYQNAFAGTGDTYTGNYGSSYSQAGDFPRPFYNYYSTPNPSSSPVDSGNADRENTPQAPSGGFGFASAGTGFFPFFPFFQGFGYPPTRGYRGPNGQPPQPAPGYGPPGFGPAGFNPFGFVANQMGGFAGAGAAAGAFPGFPFGRR